MVLLPTTRRADSLDKRLQKLHNGCRRRVLQD
jgi:hypothetical protein